jgi:hypothetical protein
MSLVKVLKADPHFSCHVVHAQQAQSLVDKMSSAQRMKCLTSFVLRLRRQNTLCKVNLDSICI